MEDGEARKCYKTLGKGERNGGRKVVIVIGIRECVVARCKAG